MPSQPLFFLNTDILISCILHHFLSPSPFFSFLFFSLFCQQLLERQSSLKYDRRGIRRPIVLEAVISVSGISPVACSEQLQSQSAASCGDIQNIIYHLLLDRNSVILGSAGRIYHTLRASWVCLVRKANIIGSSVTWYSNIFWVSYTLVWE